MVLGMVTGSVPMLFSLMLMQGITLSMWRSFLDRAIPTYKPGDLRKNIQTTLNTPSSTEAPVLPNLSSFESLNLQEAASNIKPLENPSDPNVGKGDNVLQSLHLLSKLDPKMLDLLNKMTTQNDASKPSNNVLKDNSALSLLSQLQSQDPVDYAQLQQQLSEGQVSTPEEVQYVQYDPNTQSGNEAGLQNDPGGEASPEQQYVLPNGQQVEYVQQIDPNYYQQSTAESDEQSQTVQHEIDPGVRYQYVDESAKDSGQEEQVQYQLSETTNSETEAENPSLIIGAPISTTKALRRHRHRHPRHRVKRRRKIRRRPKLSSLFRAKRNVQNYKNIPKVNVEMKKRPRKRSRKTDKLIKAEKRKSVSLKETPAKPPVKDIKKDDKKSLNIKKTKKVQKNKKRRYVKFNPKKKKKKPILKTSESSRIQVLVPSNTVTSKRVVSLQTKKIQIDEPNHTMPTNCSLRRAPDPNHPGMSLLWNDKEGWVRSNKDCSFQNSTQQNSSTVTMTAAPNMRTTTFPTVTKFFRGKIPIESEFEIFTPVTNKPIPIPSIPRIQQTQTSTSSTSLSNISTTVVPTTSILMNVTESWNTTESSNIISTTTGLPPSIYINVTCAPTNGTPEAQPQSIKLPEHIVINLINNLRSKSKQASTPNVSSTESAVTSTTTTTTTTTSSPISVNPLTILFKHLHEQQLKQQQQQQDLEPATTQEPIIKNKTPTIELQEERRNTINQNEILNHILTTINSKRITDSEADTERAPKQRLRNDRTEATTSKNDIFRQDILNHVLAAINASRIDDFDLSQMNKIPDIIAPKKVHSAKGIKIRPTPSETESDESDEDDESENSLSTEMSSNNRFKRVCYYLLNGGRDGQLEVDLLELHICSHLIVGYAKVHPNGLVVAERPLEDTEKYRRIAMLKNRNPKLKVLLSIGDLGGATFSVVASTNRTRRVFADSVMDLCKEFQFDGVDIDWEFPAIRTGFKPDRINLIHLLVELREREEHQWRNHNNNPLIISMAVGTPLVIASTSYIIPALAKLVDFVNLMSYDFHYFRPDRPFTGHHAPLYPRSSDKAYYSTLNVAWSATYWASRGMPLNKIIVGVPTYARTYNLVVPIGQGVMNAPASGVGLGGGKLNYTAVCDFLATPNTVEQFDQHCQVPYAYRDYDWIAYENEMSVAIKTQWVVKTGMGGVVSFALNFDDSLGHCRRDGKKFPLQKTISNLLELASIKSYKQNSYVMAIRN